MDVRQALAAQTYANAKPTIAPDEGAGLAGMASDFAATLEQGEEVARQTMLGEADPHLLVQALSQTQLAVETAVTLRDKVVEAYQEILRMPV